jgi:hypothetical protein
MERNLDFAYGVKEAVSWAFEQREPVRIFLSNPKYNDENNYVKRQVDEMLTRGWDDKKILKMCSEKLPSALNRSPRRPLPEIVASDHPIVDRWDETEVRLALHRMAQVRIAEAKARSFEIIIETGDDNYWTLDYRKGEIEVLERFVELLTQKATPAMGIRNR